MKIPLFCCIYGVFGNILRVCPINETLIVYLPVGTAISDRNT